METRRANESYVEYEYHGSSQSGMNARPPSMSSRPPLIDAVNDEEYLYENPKISNNQHPWMRLSTFHCEHFWFQKRPFK